MVPYWRISIDLCCWMCGTGRSYISFGKWELTSFWQYVNSLLSLPLCLLLSRTPYAIAGVLSCFSLGQLFATLWNVVFQAPLSMGFSRPEYWSGLPCLPPGDLPDTGIQLASLTSPALAGRFFTTSATWEAPKYIKAVYCHPAYLTYMQGTS